MFPSPGPEGISGQRLAGCPVGEALDTALKGCGADRLGPPSSALGHGQPGQCGQGSSWRLPRHSPLWPWHQRPAFTQSPGPPSTGGCRATALGVRLHAFERLVLETASSRAAGCLNGPLLPSRVAKAGMPPSCRCSGCPRLRGSQGHVPSSLHRRLSTCPHPLLLREPGPSCLPT